MHLVMLLSFYLNWVAEVTYNFLEVEFDREITQLHYISNVTELDVCGQILSC